MWHTIRENLGRRFSFGEATPIREEDSTSEIHDSRSTQSLPSSPQGSQRVDSDFEDDPEQFEWF